MKIAVGSDHVGLALKNDLIQYLQELGIEVEDYGAYAPERCDYPDYGYLVAKAVAEKRCDKGIVCCGTGIGISIAANKVHGIRCAVCSEPYSAKLSREHNDTNMLSMGSRVVGTGAARMIVEAWLSGEYEGGRHQNRLDKIAQIEQGKFEL